jgi:uncharacterized membrane-anchored protein YjiN (DUF445 family)
LADDENKIVQILRGYEKNGEALVEVVEARAMSREAVAELLKKAQEEKKLTEAIEELENKSNIDD